MNPELERLEAALRAAHAAGDTEAARRFAMEIVRIRSAGAGASPEPTSSPAPASRIPAQTDPYAEVPEQMHEYHVRGGKLYFDREGKLEVPDPQNGSVAAPAQPVTESSGTPSTSVDENTVRLHAQYGANGGAQAPEVAAALADTSIAHIRNKLERNELLTPEEAVQAGFASPEEAQQEWAAEAALARARAQGRASVEPVEGFNAAAVAQGFGSGLFGVGTPLSALGEMIASRFDSEPGALSWDESKEFARGRRDELAEQHPQEFYGGVIGSLFSARGAVRGMGAAARAVAPQAASVFAMQTGQAARNVARLAAAGAAAGGVTAANEEGLEAAPGGAALGAVAGTATAGLLRAGAVPARAVAGRMNADNAAIRLLAKRMGEPAAAVQRRYDEFVATRGRPPRLVEIMRRETAEEMGQISRVRSAAGDVFRQAEEDAARQLPSELSIQVRNGQQISSEPVAAARRSTITAEAADVAGRRVQSTDVAQTARRDVQMDRVMGRIGTHRVPVTQEMLEVVQHPDVQNSLDPAVRRRLNAAIEAGGDGTPYLSVARWDMIRQELAGRAGPGAGQIYGRLRDRVRDYVSTAVPEYGAALREFGRRSDTARGTAAGQDVLTKSTRAFADMLRTAGGGTADAPTRPGVRVAEQAGVRVGARTAIANALGGDPAKAERFMERLARDPAMRARVQLALRADEADELSRLAERYGQQLDFSAGLRTGRAVVKQNDTDTFREAVAQAGQPERAGVRQGARAALTEAAGESPAGAARTARRMAEDPGLQNRIAWALGSGEAQRLGNLGRSVTESSRRLAEAAPGGATQAQARAHEAAEGVQRVIQASVIASGRWSGAFLGNFANNIVQRTRLSKAAARRLAELATDPARADQVIARLRRAGVESDAILQMYQDAATAAGIQAGRE